MILLTGFGPFGEVDDNPSARLVRALHGAQLGGVPVRGLVLPVSYTRGPAAAIEAARTLRAQAVIGFGVAVRRSRIEVESRAVAACVGDDIDGQCPPCPAPGPATRAPTLDAAHLAACLGAAVSTDAGTYVCNAWLYRVPAALDVPAGFIHIPPQGVDPDQVRRGLEAWWTARSTAHP